MIMKKDLPLMFQKESHHVFFVFKIKKRSSPEVDSNFKTQKIKAIKRECSQT